MLWKVTTKQTKSTLDLKVSAMCKEIAELTYATTAQEFETAFNSQVKLITSGTHVKAEYAYKVTLRNTYSLEVWKLTIKGDFNYKMLEITYNQ